ncbi:hypothetical protein ACTU6V_02170 [Microbacterium sp. A204]|uniref:hypothetical protein n=1 Tax=Microbacterium sp. A204 TaxID=3457321 RepID=UPI003FD3D1B0
MADSMRALVIGGPSLRALGGIGVLDEFFAHGAGGDDQSVRTPDGLTSSTREWLFPDAPEPEFSGQGAWRAIVPRPAEVASTKTADVRFARAVSPDGQPPSSAPVASGPHCPLIGDAVHATTPHLTAGAGLGLEDAVVLADETESYRLLTEPV